MPVIRPMVLQDVPAVHEATVATFAALEVALGEEPHPPPDPARAQIRYRHLVRTDPGGSWVAEDERGIAGCALALLREGVWGLSLLIVRPDLQSAGVGSELLRRANDYANGARGRIILASPDARALRAYSRLGLHMSPAMGAKGAPQGVEEPPGLRLGGLDDLPLTEAVDRHVRGAAHGSDIGTQLEMGQTLLVAPDRGYAVFGNGELRMLAAFDADGARALLRGVFARSPQIELSWLTAAQPWAVEECVAARLELLPGHGAVFTDGDVGPFTPYIPSGAFL